MVLHFVNKNIVQVQYKRIAFKGKIAIRNCCILFPRNIIMGGKKNTCPSILIILSMPLYILLQLLLSLYFSPFPLKISKIFQILFPKSPLASPKPFFSFSKAKLGWASFYRKIFHQWTKKLKTLSRNQHFPSYSKSKTKPILFQFTL